MSAEHLHLDLFIEGAREGATQPVPAEALGDGRFRILSSPGFVEGIAAGDVIRVHDPRTGRFDVLERGGNLSIKVLGHVDVAHIRERLERDLGELGGWCDGAVRTAAVFTVPVRAGFESVEAVMTSAVRSHPAFGWYYGNVHAEDGVTPLGWWTAFLDEDEQS